MIRKKIKELKDAQEFKLSVKSKVTYTVIKKVERGQVIYNSNNSNRSYKAGKNLTVYVSE